MRILVVDAANVIGSVPDGWWADRPGAARRLHDGLVAADPAHVTLASADRGLLARVPDAVPLGPRTLRDQLPGR